MRILKTTPEVGKIYQYFWQSRANMVMEMPSSSKKVISSCTQVDSRGEAAVRL